MIRPPPSSTLFPSTTLSRPPVREKIPAGKTKAAPAIGAFHGPADREIVRFLRRARDDDWFQSRIIFAEANAVVVFLLRRERLHTPCDRMLWCGQRRFGFPGLNRGIPMIRRGAGFVN